MNSLLYHLINDTIDFHTACADLAQALPGYRAARTQYEAAYKAIDALREQPVRSIFLRFEDANNAMSALNEQAAMLVGFRMCLNLLTEGLR